MTNTELLPCPFCRGKAHLSTVGRSWYRITAEHAEGCILEEHESDCPQTDDQLPLLLRDWNTRSGFTAVDMGTAAADGFRDGAASVVVDLEPDDLINEAGDYLYIEFVRARIIAAGGRVKE